MKLRTLALAALLCLPSICEAQPFDPVIQLTYQNGLLTYDIGVGETPQEVQLYTWKYYLNINRMGPAPYNVEISNQRASCWSINSNDQKPWRCMLEVPVMALGSNVIQVTYTAGGVESPKSNAVVFFNSVNTQSIVSFKIDACKAGTYKVNYFKFIEALETFMNSVTPDFRIVFSYATANYVYAVTCKLE